MKIKVENAYSDGHESTLEYDVDDAKVQEYVTHPDFEDVDEALEELLFEFTGDGHGIDSDLGSYYEVTVLDGEFAGKTFDWGD